jgi:pseudouridine synthase
MMAPVRLQKLLARAGVASRRACEEIIAAGRVSVDGRIVTEPGAKADPDAQDVRLDGSRLRPERPEYWLFNKPEGVVCTNLDPSGRPRPIDFMRQSRARLFPVGRLDADSRGALLMTNDGEFANRLAHPRFEVPKTYLATVVGKVTGEDIRRLVRGVYLSEGQTSHARVRLVKSGRSRSLVEVTIREGRNRQIRRMLARLGHGVRELVRTRIGRVTLRGLSSGESRRLEPEEVADLTKFAETPPPERTPAAKTPRRGGPRRGKTHRVDREDRGRPRRRKPRPFGRSGARRARPQGTLRES